MKIVVIDGQGGKIGQAVIAALKAAAPSEEIYAIGTNSAATAAMLKAGADHGATGENPVIVAGRDADIIVGPIGIVIADSLLGELTPAMAVAVGQSRAQKFLIPLNKCATNVIGASEMPFSDYIKQTAASVLAHIAEQ
ncbi:MAG: DUF3842 family protein [Oscillospiraceae bacterium]|nr:DUF3842 family protein [Oscillospiraceae bacterium]